MFFTWDRGMSYKYEPDNLSVGPNGSPSNGFDLEEQARKEQQTRVMKEEIDILRDQVKKLRPDLGRQNSLLSAGYSVAIACILQIASFMVSGTDWKQPSWGTVTTLIILIVSVVVIVYARVCKKDEADTFEAQKDSIQMILNRIFPPDESGAHDHAPGAALPPARHWWQKLFRKLAGI